MFSREDQAFIEKRIREYKKCNTYVTIFFRKSIYIFEYDQLKRLFPGLCVGYETYHCEINGPVRDVTCYYAIPNYARENPNEDKYINVRLPIEKMLQDAYDDMILQRAGLDSFEKNSRER